jgi:hypothetical protein
MQSYTCLFFFLGLLLRRGLWASEFELRVLLWSAATLDALLFLNELPLVLVEALLELDNARLSTNLALFGGNERGGGIRTRASFCRCIHNSAQEGGLNIWKQNYESL